MNQIAYLECRDGIHNKFYLMTMTDPCGANFTIRWGRIGTEGSSCLQPISNIVNGIVRGYATVAEKANVKEGTLVEGDTYYIQS